MKIILLTIVAAFITTAGLFFTQNASAHNIDLKAAREEAREFARGIRDSPGRNYKHYATKCVAAFAGHNHVARCSLFFQTAEDKKKNKWTCTEKLEFYHDAHGRTGPLGIFESFGSTTIKMRPASKKRC